MKNLGFTRICREIADVAIYAHYPESFCSENLAIRKVFAFSDSGVLILNIENLSTNIKRFLIVLFYGHLNKGESNQDKKAARW